MHNSIFLVAVMLSTVLVAGCYPDWPEHAGKAEVHGRVTLDGAPVGGAKVVFMPFQYFSSSGKVMPLAFGLTNAEGEFELQYADKTKELTAGNYNVIISKAKKPDGDSVPVDFSGLASELVPPAFLNSPLCGDTEVIPAIYNRESTLTYTIEASPKVVRAKFELSSVDPLIKSAN